jgi:hypothetical protein
MVIFHGFRACEVQVKMPENIPTTQGFSIFQGSVAPKM